MNRHQEHLAIERLKREQRENDAHEQEMSLRMEAEDIEQAQYEARVEAIMEDLKVTKEEAEVILEDEE